MLDFIQKHYLTVSTLCVGGVLKGIKVLLECMYSFMFFVDDFPDNAVSTTTYFFDNIVSEGDVRLNFIVVLTHGLEK
jgi:hypothetical protein